MNEIFSIIFRLTLSCILAGTVMGTTFVFTNKAKKHNEHLKEERVAYSLLGFDKEPPESVALDTVYRYVVTQGGVQTIGYLLPVGAKNSQGYTFLQIDLDGNLVAQDRVDLTAESVRETGDRESGLQAALGPGFTLRFADQTQIVTDDQQRVAYLISGKFPGYKTHIAVMMAIRPDFSIIGFEVLEHEEDPGLGGEIEMDYFKNQFKDKPYDILKGQKVIKEPIPERYLQALTLKLAESEIEKVMEEFRGNDIYALTGATISTDAVNDGLKGMVKKFAFRINTLDTVVKEQGIAVAF